MSNSRKEPMTATERLQREKAEIWSPDYVPPALRTRGRTGSRTRTRTRSVSMPQLVAEGDSWFDYPPGKDVLDWLRGEYGYRIERFADAGDTLENMVYGTEIQRSFRRRPAGLVEVLEAVRRLKPVAVLLSAGGNDFAGEDLLAYLNHATSPESEGGTRWLRETEWRQALSRSKSAIRAFAEAVWRERAEAVVVMHGYARPVPDGRAVVNVPGGFRFFGPWLRPIFARKGYTDWPQTEPWIGRLADDYNDLLAALAEEYGPRFRYVDVRAVVGRKDWANELHPTNAGFARVAARLHAELQTLKA